MPSLETSLITLAELGRLPDAAIRLGMRRLISARRASLVQASLECQSTLKTDFINDACQQPVAVVPGKANEQHYEVPAEFFRASLGQQLKYSCCYWDNDTVDLNTAETLALQETCINAQLRDGQRILELGCGWGSLSLWMAQHYPQSSILAVSNSASQKAFIDQLAKQRGLSNLIVQTCDINTFAPVDQQFDRVVSVEMFEHVRNHRTLMSRISDWLSPEGKLFVHIFCHDRQPYLFLDEGETDWMTRYFFAGGMMPSRDLLLHHQIDLTLERQLLWDGTHYEKTSNAWLATMDRNHETVEACFRKTYGNDWKLWRQRWRMFYMACAELFGYRRGQEWYVSHYLFAKSARGIAMRDSNRLMIGERELMD